MSPERCGLVLQGAGTTWARRPIPLGAALVGSFLGACSRDSAPPVAPETPDTVALARSVEMRPTQLYMDSLHFAVDIRAIAYDADGRFIYNSGERPERFSWSSSAADVVSVDPAGRVTSEGWGEAVITATDRGGSKSSTRVRVRDAVNLAWSSSLGAGAIQAGITIGPDGTIYVTSMPHGDVSALHAITRDGGVLWSRDLPATGPMTPAIGDDGTVYVGSRSAGSGGQLTAVRPGGTVAWVLEGLAPLRSSPALGADGAIHVAGGAKVYAVEPHGTIRWVYEGSEGVFVWSSPAIASDGTIYVGGDDRVLYAITPGGSLRWTFETNGLVQSSPAIGADGTVYFGSEDGRLYAVRPDGTEAWTLELDRGGVAASPAIGPDGTIYVVAGDLFAIDPDGSIRWRYPAGSHGFQPTPLVGADGTVYFAGQAITALDAEGNLLWTHPVGEATMGSPALGIDGAIIVGTFSVAAPDVREAFVHALVETSSANGGSEGAPWPTARGNRANNGRAGG